MNNTRNQYLIGIIASFVLLFLSLQNFISIGMSLLEVIAVITSAWGVWLLAKNNPLGWWIGLIGVVIYGFIFYKVKLFAEIILQVFYFITGLQGIYIWWRGGKNKTEKPIGHLHQKWIVIIISIVLPSVFALREFLILLGGAAPFWDALTTVISVVAQIFLMGRYIESWYLWITVDVIYLPLYASRGLYLTSFLYGVFLLMAINGLINFKRIYKQQTR